MGGGSVSELPQHTHNKSLTLITLALAYNPSTHDDRLQVGRHPLVLSWPKYLLYNSCDIM